MKKINSVLAVFLAAMAAAHAATYNWVGPTGDSDVGGVWSSTVSWGPSGTKSPAAGGDVGVLGDVTTGTRTIIYDINGGYVSTIQFNQTTAGAVNLLDIQKNLTVSNPFVIGATAGSAQVAVESGATLTFGQGGTIGTNGVLSLYNPGSSEGSVTTNSGYVLTVAGGLLRVAASQSASSASNTIRGDFAMTSGTILIENDTGTQRDRRLSFNANVNITGGVVASLYNGASGQIFLNGTNNVFNPTSFYSGSSTTYCGIGIVMSAGSQQLSTNQTLAGGLVLRGGGSPTTDYVKTIANTGSGIINQIQFIDERNNSGGVVLQLGSNLSLATSAVMPSVANYSNQVDGSGGLQVGIDANGYTLNLTPGANYGVWTVAKSTQGGVTTTTWQLSNSGAAGTGVIAANGFIMSSSGVVTNIGEGLVLEARGGNGTLNDLGGSGSIAATSVFRYAGTATSANTAAKLISNRTIGGLEVKSGYLNVQGISTSGGVNINGGTMLINDDPSNPHVGTLNVGAGQAFIMSSGGIFFTMEDNITFDQIVGSAGSVFSISGGTITLDLQDIQNFDYSSSYALFSGFDSGLVSGLNIIGYDTSSYFAKLGTDGMLTFEAIPEPGTVALLACGGLILLLSYCRNRKLA
jgi:hypothetical protein